MTPEQRAATCRQRDGVMRESERPAFTCGDCGQAIEGVVVLPRRWAVAWGHHPPLCESCYTQRSYTQGKRLGGEWDPSRPDWTPWPSWMLRLARLTDGKCFHCQRPLMGAEYCCDRCRCEAEKTARDVEHDSRDVARSRSRAGAQD